MLVLLLQLGGDFLVLAQRRLGVAHLRRELAGAHARLEILGVERAEANGDFGGALLVAARLALVGDKVEKLLRVCERALLGGEIARLQQRVFVIGFELEDLLEDRQGL